VGVPVRIARPENLIGMVDRLDSPAFSTSVGLLRWALLFSDVTAQGPRRKSTITKRGGGAGTSGPMNMEKIKNWLRRLLP
jgi:cell division protein FtsA